MSRAERIAKVSSAEPLSISRQCRLLGLSRNAFHRPAPAIPERDLALMRRMDALHLDCPFYGSRQMAAALRLEGLAVGRRRVRRLMRLMGLDAVCPKPSASVKAPSHKVFPYLLRGMEVTEPN